jgi:metal iron transporter
VHSLGRESLPALGILIQETGESLVYGCGDGKSTYAPFFPSLSRVTDLAAGSQYGYALLFVVLLSGLFGIFLQILAVRMGVVTGQDLACNTRLLCLPEGPDGEVRQNLRWRKSRVGLLWFSYLISEGALIATELAELLGSAIALNL